MERSFRSQNEYEKEFVGLIDGLCHGHQRWQVWQDLMSAMACSLSNVADHTPERSEKREKEYAECIKRLGGVDVPAKAFAIVVMALDSNPDQDFLGSMYMRLDLGNHWTGQFFTPYCISKLMAQISLAGIEKQVEQRGWVSVCDPCIGGGAMLVAAANTAKEKGINFQNHLLFVGQDIDRIVGIMAYIQLSILGCPGYIAIANTITNPITGHPLIPDEEPGQEFWYTPFYFKQEWDMRRKIFVFENLMRENVKKPQIPGEKVEEGGFMLLGDWAKESEKMAVKTENIKFASGVEKLKYEQGQCLASVNAAYRSMVEAQYGQLFKVLIKKCQDEPPFDALVLQEHKSWSRCMKYLVEQAMKICNPTDEQKRLAREERQPIAAPVSYEVVLQWIEAYYRADDKVQAEKEAKVKAKTKKIPEKKATHSKVPETKKQECEAKEITLIAAKTVEKKAKKKPESKKAEIEGQISLFELLQGGNGDADSI